MASTGASSAANPMPREHGAWGLLFQPFVAGAILAGRWSWLLLPAACLLFVGFILREPLVILARQWLVWRAPNPITRRAIRWLLVEMTGLALCVAALATAAPWRFLATFLAAGVVLTLLTVWVIIRNRQRSVPFQCVSAVLLGGTSQFSIFLSMRMLPSWAPMLWAALTIHAVAAILVVHTRLNRRSASRTPEKDPQPGVDFARQLFQIPLSAVLAALYPALLLPAAFSLGASLLEVRRVYSGSGLQEPLTRVGIRTLAISLVHMALTIAALWPLAQGN